MRIYSDGKSDGKLDPYWDNVHFTQKEEKEMIRCFMEATILHKDELNNYHIDWLSRFSDRFFIKDKNLNRRLYDTLRNIYRELGINLPMFFTNKHGEQLGSWYTIPSRKKYPDLWLKQTTNRRKFREKQRAIFDELCSQALEDGIKEVKEKKSMAEALLGDARKVASASNLNNLKMGKYLVGLQKEIEKIKTRAADDRGMMMKKFEEKDKEIRELKNALNELNRSEQVVMSTLEDFAKAIDRMQSRKEVLVAVEGNDNVEVFPVVNA